MSTDAATPRPQPDSPLPDDPVVLKQMLRELLGTVAALRATIDKQQAHIHYLVRMTFGRRSERVEGPTLFDALPDAEPPPLAGPLQQSFADWLAQEVPRALPKSKITEAFGVLSQYQLA